MKLTRPIALLAALAALTGCGSIGEGSTVVSLEIRDPGGRPITGDFPISQCLRDQMIAVATFTDGTQADFSYRVTWTSSNPDLVQVSNNEIEQQFVSEDDFAPLAGSHYRPGTLVPDPGVTAGSTVTISARFLNMVSTQQVRVTEPTFRIAPLVDGLDPKQPPSTPYYMGPSTSQQLGFYVEKEDGQFLLPTGNSLVGSLNPVLWRFVDADGNTFDPADPADVGDFHKFVVPGVDNPHASITPSSGLVRAIAADPAEYTVQATTSLCKDVAQFTPTTKVSVAPFAATPLRVQHEPDINGPGTTASPTGDLIAGTGEQLKVIADLDTAAGVQPQDISRLADLRIDHTLECTSGEPNCTCDTAATPPCTKRLLSNNGSFLFSLISNDRDTANVSACYTNVDVLHSNDCEEDATAAGKFRLVSDPIAINVVPVKLDAGTATLSIEPAGAAECAFAYPGQQFEAYGLFTALDDQALFFGGSTTATQKITRNVAWTTQAQDSTVVLPGFVRNASDGYFGAVGSFNYVRDVAVDTPVQVGFLPLAPFASIEAPAAVSFTVRPSADCP